MKTKLFNILIALGIVGSFTPFIALTSCNNNPQPQIEGLKSCEVADFEYTESTGMHGDHVTLHFIYKVEIEYEKDIQEIVNQNDWIISGHRAVKVFDIEESKGISSAGKLDGTKEIQNTVVSIMTDTSQYTFAYSGTIEYTYEWDWDEQYHHATNARWTKIPQIKNWKLIGI